MNDFEKDSPYRRNKEEYVVHSDFFDRSDNLVTVYKRKGTDLILFLKEINLRNSYDEDRFKNEVKTLICMRLDGFPFIKIDGFGIQNSNAFIAVEYIEGGSLQSFLFDDDSDDEMKLDNSMKMKILYGTAYGLNYLHSKGFVHRDIKPDNIFLNDDREPFIGDYGFSKQIINTSRMTGSIGTVPYMAPELLEEQIAKTDNSVDVYSFAITALQIITNDLKFNNKSIFDDDDQITEDTIKRKILNGKRYDLPESVPGNFKKFIADCWSPTPSERWKMDRIVKSMKDDLILPDTNMEEYNMYIQKLDDAYKDLLINKK